MKDGPTENVRCGATWGRKLVCQDCHRQFSWPVGEQNYYAERSWAPPRRCKPCRRKLQERDR
jgi:hypothetical protein